MKIEKYFDETLKKHFWKVDITINGKRYREKGYPTKKELEDAVIELKNAARSARLGLSRPPQIITFSQLHQARKNDTDVSGKKAALRVLSEVMTILKEDFPLTDLKRYHIKLITEHFQKRVQVGSVNQYLGLLSAALHAAPLYFLELDEWTPPKIPRVKGATHRERVLTREELGKIFKELNQGDYHQDVGDALRLMLLTGARKKELTGLTIEKVNQDWQTTQFLKTKNGLNRTVAVSNMVLEILRRRAGKPLLVAFSHQYFWKLIARASTAAGVIYGDQVEGGWVPHDLRHTAATVLETAGVKYSAVAAVLGHKRSDQTATYTHASLGDLRAAVKVLETWCQGIVNFIPDHDENRGLYENLKCAK